MLENKRIKKLDGHVIDQIAAGEVVERPAQLVKELIENSIDAGATKVTLSVDSSLTFINITDNGSGIIKEDLPLVFQRHSTSKLKSADEIFHLSSFGFRGEALSAIGSVSKVNLETKTKEEQEGSALEWSFGEITSQTKSSIEEGTDIKISSLFENVPARKKFLKSERFELTQVKKVFSSFALFHFDKDFKFLVDGKLKEFYQKKDSPQERYAQINKGKKVYKLPLLADDVFHSNTKIYLEEPSFDSKNSSGLWIYTQERWIQDKTIAAAIRDGLSTYLMHGTFPKGLVFLDLAPKFVDVNVHPMKSQVRFADNSKVYSYLRKNTARWAESSPWLEKTVRSEQQQLQSSNFKEQSGFSSTYQTNESQNKSESNDFSTYAVKDQKSLGFKEYDQVQYKKTEVLFKEEVPKKLVFKENQSVSTNSFEEPTWASLQVLGQTNLTYIIAQSSEAMFLIDQHAAHERVGYEKLLKAWQNSESMETQALLLPVQMDLPEEQLEALIEKQIELKKLGVEFEQTGPESIALTLLPAFLKEEAVIKALEIFAKEALVSGGSVAVEDAFKLLFATMSCHSVIRAGHAMALDEMKLLLSEMDKYRSSYCPHGRPVYKKIPFTELDRDFGRTL